MALNKIKTSSLDDDSVTSAKLANGAVTANDINDGELPLAKISQVNLDIAPEVLEIQVSAPAAGQATTWLWTWLTSSLPYARREVTNSPEIQVPLYRQGTYTVNNYAAYDLFDQMTQTHSLYLKWIDGAGTDNLISWATSTGPVSDSHPDINSGNATDVQRINISVPATITLPTLTPPTVNYTVVNNGAGAYTFSGAAKGDNPNIGPFYRGGTYTFNITASGHPLYLTTDNGTNFASGTYFGEYTDGVTGSRTDSGTLTIVVPNDAPDTLYYQCGNHSVMRGAITVKDLAVETNINGNPVVYFQHTQEGHKTPVELRPIPSLVNQMCLVYDAGTGKFVPQDLATYVENTPSFENKIREVAGTAELVVEDGSAVVAKVNVYQDSTYLPLVGNNAGDQAFATDNNKLYIWDGSAWQLAGAANTGELPEGTNLYYTDARVGSYLSSNGYDTATNIVASITDSAPATLDTLNELAAALGDDPNFATTVTNSIADKLPLAGGTLTGVLTVPEVIFTDADPYLKVDTDTKHLVLSGGTGWQSTGATLILRGSGDSSNAHGFELSAGGATTVTVDGNRKLTHAGNWAFLGGYNAGGQYIPADYGVGFATNITNGRAESAILNTTDPATYTGTGIGFFQRTGGSTYDNLLYLKHDGNVGIGTTNPEQNLHIKRASGSDTGGQGHILFDVADDGGPAYALRIGDVADDGDFHIDRRHSGIWYPSLSIDRETGNVGIGDATTPTASLHVRDTSSDADVVIETASQTLRIDQNSIRTTTSSPLAMFTNNNAQNGFRIENDGRMIIGNTSGQTNVKLTVNGNLKMGTAAAASWANSVHDIGGLDVIVGSGSHALQLWDDNYQSRPRFEVQRDGHVWAGQNMQFHENNTASTAPFDITNSSSTQNFFVPNTYGSGNVNQTYRHCYTINAAHHWVLFRGGGGNTVFNTYAFISGDHYQDINVWSITLYYSDLKIKIIQNTGADKSIWVAGNTYNNNVYNLNWRIMPVEPCTIQHNPSGSQSTGYHIHHATGGEQFTETSAFASGSGPTTY